LERGEISWRVTDAPGERKKERMFSAANPEGSMKGKRKTRMGVDCIEREIGERERERAI